MGLEMGLMKAEKRFCWVSRVDFIVVDLINKTFCKLSGVLLSFVSRFAFLTPYQFTENNPIQYVDLDGQEKYDPNNVNNHYDFFVTSAILLYDAAKAKGASDAGALFVIAQAAFESRYGEKAKDDFNFFNIKAGAGQAKGRKAADGGYFVSHR